MTRLPLGPRAELADSSTAGGDDAALLSVVVVTGIFPPDIGGPVTHAANLTDEHDHEGPGRDIEGLRHEEVVASAAGGTGEAVATGVPIVASDLPTMREASGSRDDVLFVPAGDAGALAGATEERLQRCRAGTRKLQQATVGSWDDRARVFLCEASGRDRATRHDAC